MHQASSMPFRKGLVVFGFVLFAVQTSVWAQQSPTAPRTGGPGVGDVVQRPPQAPMPEQRREGRVVQQESVTAPVRATTGGESQVRVVGGQQAFEPFKELPLSYGPPPETAADIQLSSVGPMPAMAFLDELSLATGWNIVAAPLAAQTQLQFWITELTPQQALNVLRLADLYYEYDPESEILYVATKDEYLSREHGRLVEQEFNIQHAAVADVEAGLAALLSPRGRLIADPHTSKVLVIDTQYNITHMTRVLGEMDQPRETRAFELAHINAEALWESVEALMTERGELYVDPRSNTLVVIDRPDRLMEIGDVVAVLDKELETRTWTLDYADPEVVAEQVAVLVPEEMGSIEADPLLHQITVTATPYRLAQVEKRIGMWDRKRRQVQIEAYLVTVSKDVARDLGINWAYIDEHGGSAFGFQVGNISNALNTGSSGQLGEGQRLSFMDTDFTAVLDLLETEGDATILAHPRITVQDGAEATFRRVTQVPYSQSTTRFGGVDQNNLNTVSTVSFIDVGTVLRVVPRIAGDDNVLLEIAAEDSSFITRQFVSNGLVNEVPEKTENLAETEVLVQNEQTIVLGGLRTANYSDTKDKIPFLGDIPLIGRAFRSTTKQHDDSELLIFMTPTIVDEGTHPEASKLASFDQDMATQHRLDEGTAFKRAKHYLQDGKNEIPIAVGQTGEVFANGNLVSLDELTRALGEVEDVGGKTVVIRTHPRAPASTSTRVTDIVLEHGFKLEFDTHSFPFVPSAREE